MDPLINDWDERRANEKDSRGRADARKFLDEWIRRMNPLYMAVSLPNDFRVPRRFVAFDGTCATLSFRPRKRTICHLR